MKIETVNMDSIPYVSKRIRNPDIAMILAAFPRLSDGEVLKCTMEDIRSVMKLVPALKYYQNSRDRSRPAMYPDMRLSRRKNLVFVWKEPTQE